MVRSTNRCFAAVAMALGWAAVAGCGGGVAMPTSYQNYKAKDDSFAIDYPANWEAVGGGQGTYYSARFTSGSASVKVTADVVATALSDIGQSQLATMGGGADLAMAIVTVHNKGKEQMSSEWSNYQEQEPVKVPTAFGDGRQAEFTASGAFGGKVRGCRLTALSGFRRISVVALCNEGEWTKVKPVFDKMIASLKGGKGSEE